MNRSKTKHCVLHIGMITWNSLPDVFKVNCQCILFDVQEQGTKFLSRKIFENIDAGCYYDCIFFSDMPATAFFQVNCFWF